MHLVDARALVRDRRAGRLRGAGPLVDPLHLHRFTTAEEVEYVGQRTIEVIKRLREMSPLYELAKEGVDIKTIKWKAE